MNNKVVFLLGFYDCLGRIQVIAVPNFRVQLFNSANTCSGFSFGNTLFKSLLSGPYVCMETLSKETWKSLLAKSPFGCLWETPWQQYFSFPKLHCNPKRFAMISSRDTLVLVTGESICVFSENCSFHDCASCETCQVTMIGLWTSQWLRSINILDG